MWPQRGRPLPAYPSAGVPISSFKAEDDVCLRGHAARNRAEAPLPAGDDRRRLQDRPYEEGSGPVKGRNRAPVGSLGQVH